MAPRSGGRRGSRIRWDRFGRIVLVLVLFGVIGMYARPMLSVADSWNDAKAEDRRLEDVKRENRQLQKRHDQLIEGSNKSPARQKAATTGTGTTALTPSSGTQVTPETGGVLGAEPSTETGAADPTVLEPDSTLEADPAPDPGVGGTGQVGADDPSQVVAGDPGQVGSGEAGAGSGGTGTGAVSG